MVIGTLPQNFPVITREFPVAAQEPITAEMMAQFETILNKEAQNGFCIITSKPAVKIHQESQINLNIVILDALTVECQPRTVKDKNNCKGCEKKFKCITGLRDDELISLPSSGSSSSSSSMSIACLGTAATVLVKCVSSTGVTLTDFSNNISTVIYNCISYDNGKV